MSNLRLGETVIRQAFHTLKVEEEADWVICIGIGFCTRLHRGVVQRGKGGLICRNLWHATATQFQKSVKDCGNSLAEIDDRLWDLASQAAGADEHHTRAAGQLDHGHIVFGLLAVRLPFRVDAFTWGTERFRMIWSLVKG